MTPTPQQVWHSAIDGPDRVPVDKIMSRDPVCVRSDLDLATAVRLMITHHLGCLPVVDERKHPVGIVTKFDLVEQLDTAMRESADGMSLAGDLRARTVDELMMPVVFVVDENATILRASSLMVVEDTHHVLVTSRDGALVGVVSTKDIVRWLTGDVSSAASAADTAARGPRVDRRRSASARP